MDVKLTDEELRIIRRNRRGMAKIFRKKLTDREMLTVIIQAFDDVKKSEGS